MTSETQDKLLDAQRYAASLLAELSAAKREISLLQDAVVSYGDRVRMATAYNMELQQVIDRAFERET